MPSDYIHQHYSGARKRSHIVVWFLLVFFLITTSFMLHEFIHVLQFQSLGANIQEIVLLGWKHDEKGPITGWVIGTTKTQLNTNLYETVAYIVQSIYVAVGYITLSRLIKGGGRRWTT